MTWAELREQVEALAARQGVPHIDDFEVKINGGVDIIGARLSMDHCTRVITLKSWGL